MIHIERFDWVNNFFVHINHTFSMLFFRTKPTFILNVILCVVVGYYSKLEEKLLHLKKQK